MYRRIRENISRSNRWGKMRKKILTIILFLLGLGVFLGIFYFIGIGEVVSEIKKANLFYYSVAILFAFAVMVFWSFRWKVFIDVGYKTSIIEVFKITLVGFSLNNLTPIAKLGGEPVRAYILKKRESVPGDFGLAAAFSELSAELIISIAWALITVLLLFFIFNPPLWVSSFMIAFIIISLICFASIFGLYSGNPTIDKIIIWFTKKIKRLRPLQGKILSKYKKFQKSFRRGLKNKKLFTKAILFSLMIKISNILKFLFIFMALGYEITILEIVIIMGITIMLMSVPATPGNLGIVEGGLISALVLMGVPVGIAGSVVFLERLITYWVFTSLGLLMGAQYGVKLFGREY